VRAAEDHALSGDAGVEIRELSGVLGGEGRDPGQSALGTDVGGPVHVADLAASSRACNDRRSFSCNSASRPW
jgi:hypothetical protein